MSHTKMAAKLGYSKSVYFHLRSGKTPPKLDDFERLVQTFPFDSGDLSELLEVRVVDRAKSQGGKLSEIVNKLLEENQSLADEIKELKSIYSSIQKDLSKTNADQREQINKLIDLLSEKTKAL